MSTAGLASGIFIIAALFSRRLMGHFIDGLGRGLVLRTGCVLYGALVAGYFLSDTLAGFMALRFVHGFAYGVTSIVVLPFFVDAQKHVVTEAERREMRSFRLSTFLEPEAVPISVQGLFAGVCYSVVLSYIGAYAEAADLGEAGSVFFLFFAAAALVPRPLSGRMIDEFGGDVVVYPALGFFSPSRCSRWRRRIRA